MTATARITVSHSAPPSVKRDNSSSVSRARTPTASSSAPPRATGAVRTPASSNNLFRSSTAPMAARRTGHRRGCARPGTAATAFFGCRAPVRSPSSAISGDARATVELGSYAGQLNARARFRFNPGVGGDGFFQGTAIGGEGEGLFEDARAAIACRAHYRLRELHAGHQRQARLLRRGVSFGATETDTEGGFTNFTYTCIRPDNAFIQPSQKVGNSSLLNFVNATLAALRRRRFPCLGCRRLRS